MDALALADILVFEGFRLDRWLGCLINAERGKLETLGAFRVDGLRC